MLWFYKLQNKFSPWVSIASHSNRWHLCFTLVSVWSLKLSLVIVEVVLLLLHRQHWGTSHLAWWALTSLPSDLHRFKASIVDLVIVRLVVLRTYWGMWLVIMGLVWNLSAWSVLIVGYLLIYLLLVVILGNRLISVSKLLRLLIKSLLLVSNNRLWLVLWVKVLNTNLARSRVSSIHTLRCDWLLITWVLLILIQPYRRSIPHPT